MSAALMVGVQCPWSLSAILEFLFWDLALKNTACHVLKELEPIVKMRHSLSVRRCPPRNDCNSS